MKHKKRLIRVKDVESPPFFYLQQFYEFEFSRITKSDINERGLYDYKALQASWNNHHYHAYVLYIDDKPAGFAVVNLNSQIDGNPETKDIAEFFVMPNQRSKGMGKWMAFRLFDKYPGQWEVRQFFRANRARRFWISVINQYTYGHFKLKKMNHPKWKGYLETFDTTKIKAPST